MADIHVDNVAGPIFDIATAVAAAVSGDIIYVHATGVNYSGANNQNISCAGFAGMSWSDPGLRIEGVPLAGAYPIIDNDQVIGNAIFNIGNGDWIWIRRFTFWSDNHFAPIGIRTDQTSRHVLLELLEFPTTGADGWYGRVAIMIGWAGIGANSDIEIRCCLFKPNTAHGAQRAIRCFNGVAQMLIRHCLFSDIAIGIELVSTVTGTENWIVENCTFYNVTNQCIALSGAATLGVFYAHDNIFNGQTAAAPEAAFYLANAAAPAGDVESDYNDYFGNTNDVNNVAKGGNDIAVNPAFVGGGAAQWVDLIYGSTSLLPTAIAVLTGAQDGACQGGWLPATELLSCEEAEPEDPPDTPPDAPDPPPYDDCFGELVNVDCTVSSPASGAGHVASTTQLCPICLCLHTWAQAYVAAVSQTPATHSIIINTDASTIGGTPNSNCQVASAGFVLGSPTIGPGSFFVGFDVGGTPRMGRGTMSGCRWLDRPGWDGVRGVSGILNDCTFDADRASAVYADGSDDVDPDGIRVCGGTITDKVTTAFTAFNGGRIQVDGCILDDAGSGFNGLAVTTGASSYILMVGIVLLNATWNGPVFSVSHHARIVCNTAIGTVERNPGDTSAIIVNAELTLTNVNFKGGHILVQDEGVLNLAGGWHVDAANAPTGYGAIQASNKSYLDLRAMYFRHCSALDAGGAIFLTGDSHAIIDAVDIYDCTAGESGGGIALTDESSVTLTRTSIRDCTAKRGGGIYSESSAVSCNELSLRLCEATIPYSGVGSLSRAGGGAMCLYHSSGYMWRLMIADCIAICSGAGLFIEGDKTAVKIQRLTVARCEAAKYGSALFFYDVKNFNDLWDGIIALNGSPRAVRAWTNCSNVVLRFIDFWDNDGGDYLGLTVTDMINTDPLFCFETLAGYGVVGCAYISGGGAIWNLFSAMNRFLFGELSISRNGDAAKSGENGMIMGAGEVLCGIWNELWRREPPGEYEPVIHYCTYEKFYDEYPPDWEYELSRKIDAQHVTIVCYDPGGRNIQLTTMVETIRPLQSEMSITFEEYQTKDVDIVFNDPDGWLDPFNPDSLLYNDEWKDKPVEIGSWMVGTESVLIQATMYLRHSKHDGHRTTWKCYDKYQKLLKRHMRASTVLEEDIESPEPAKLLQVDVADISVCPISTWTIRFESGDDFTLFSELMGEDGSGLRTAPGGFTSTSGAIYIDPTYWDVIGGDPKAGDEFRFISSLVIPRTPALEALEIALTQYYDLTPADLDTAAWTAARAGAVAWVVHTVQKDPITALEFVKKMMLHLAGALLIGSNGKLKPWRFVPTLQGPGDVHVICSTLDLKNCQVDNIEKVDVVIAHYEKNVDGELTLTKRLPAVIVLQGIPPLRYYEEQNREIWEFDLEHFEAVDSVRIDWLLRYFYELRVLQHPRYRVDTMLDNLNLQVGDVVWLESSDPEYDVCCLVYKTIKDLAKRNIKVEIMEAEDWLVTCRTYACGYAFCDVHFCDDCWICW